MKEPKPRKFRNKRKKREWLAALLKQLSQDLLSGKYGDDGCDVNSEGYCVANVVSDAMSGYAPNDKLTDGEQPPVTPKLKPD